MLASLVLALVLQSAPVADILMRDMMSNVEEPKQASAQTEAEWAALWKLHAGTKVMPKVDLKARTVVAVFLGTRSSAGYSVEITGVSRKNGATIVEWQERRPAPGTLMDRGTAFLCRRRPPASQTRRQGLSTCSRHRCGRDTAPRCQDRETS
jgi:hypothetical protein